MGEFDSKSALGRAYDEPVPKPHVVVISPVVLYRDGLAASLAADSRLEVVALRAPANAAMTPFPGETHAVLLDANSAECLSLAKQLKHQNPNIVIVGFGISSSSAAALACAEAGLAAFIDENGSIDALVSATISALQGEFYCSPKLTAIFCNRLATLASGARATPAGSALTLREQEVASRISEGLSNKEIALDLQIRPSTVKNHVHNILDKLGARRRAAIATRFGEVRTR